MPTAVIYTLKTALAMKKVQPPYKMQQLKKVVKLVVAVKK